MDVRESDQSGYYRAIASAFLQRRGGPLLLSPRDVGVIAGWEARRIPLEAVLEGIERTFEGLQQKGRGAKGVSLARCEREVARAWQQARERGAGGRRSAPVGPGKRERALHEVERAIAGLPPDDKEAAGLLASARRILAEERPDEEALERIESALERLLYERAAPEDKSRSAREARRELRGAEADDVESLARTRVVKAVRERARIPYVSLFYY